MEKSHACPFCQLTSEQIWFETDFGIVMRDAFPISEGHALIIPKEHTLSLFSLPTETLAALWRLVSETRNRLQDELQPNGFNIGVNDGEAAGQTVLHAHIHVIPRWEGDVDDPRGGIRWVISNKASYWSNE